jgi:hypothetical protein
MIAAVVDLVRNVAAISGVLVKEQVPRSSSFEPS